MSQPLSEPEDVLWMMVLDRLSSIEAKLDNKVSRGELLGWLGLFGALVGVLIPVLH